MESTGIITKALEKALVLHSGQIRKGDYKPYIVHPIEVGLIMARYTANEDLIVAAILHDTLEDTDYTAESLKADFGENVTTLVKLLTENKQISNWTEKKSENLERMKDDKAACFIKLADSLANMQSLILALKNEGNIVWNRFNAPKDLKLKYYRIVLDHAKDIAGAELIERYVSAIKDLEYSEMLNKSTIGFLPEKPAE